MSQSRLDQPTRIETPHDRQRKPTRKLKLEYTAELNVQFHCELGLLLRSWVNWYYTFGVHCTKEFAHSYAHMLYFVKDPKRFTFNRRDSSRPVYLLCIGASVDALICTGREISRQNSRSVRLKRSGADKGKS
jgi:hypothetical protein